MVSTEPIYVMNQRVKVPSEIHPSKEGRIVGYEDAKANLFLKIRGQTYIYYVSFGDSGAAWIVSEEELKEWQST